MIRPGSLQKYIEYSIHRIAKGLGKVNNFILEQVIMCDYFVKPFVKKENGNNSNRSGSSSHKKMVIVEEQITIFWIKIKIQKLMGILVQIR